MIEIYEGAIFISDAHSNKNKKEFLEFLKSLYHDKIKTPQLIMMGDMFDILIGGNTFLKSFYHEEIEYLNKLSQKIQIIYFEGNHDFCLSSCFPNIKVIPLKKQPTLCRYKAQKLLLSHGDSFEGLKYKLTHTILRSKPTVMILNLIDMITYNSLSKFYLQKTKSKRICKNIENFYSKVKQKMILFDIQTSEIDFVFEGHYHQGKVFEFAGVTYYNLPSFACDKNYFVIKGDKITF